MHRILKIGLLLSVVVLKSCDTKRTEVILLGTIHQPIESFNSDSLYNFFLKIDPDLILFEFDSSAFTSDFELDVDWNENEVIAIKKYMISNEVEVRPYDFTGRNEYRRRIGAVPTDSKTISMIDSLYRSNFLGAEDASVYADYVSTTDTLNSFAYLGADAINDRKTDSIASIRQFYQYEKLLNITEKYEVFSSSYQPLKNGDSISYKEGFRRAGEFWNTRNHTMAQNILVFIDSYKGKKIVVLNGYYHRYYLDSLLGPHQDSKSFTLKSFKEY